MDDITPAQLDAATEYDATRERRMEVCLRGVARSDGPLADLMAARQRARFDPDAEADRIRDLED